MELSFIRASRNGEETGIRGKLNRSEFVDLLVRLGVTAYPKIAAGLSLLMVMHLLLIPLRGKSTCANERELIRSRLQVNKLLFENRVLL
jgi:hypothetical protein